jgi:tRNA G10  N-methylase Trm11
VLDPFAGTGRIASIPGIRAVAIEIEQEWATQVVGNALQLPFAAETFDAVFTSCTYGNHMADHHNARDGSKRNTYRHTLGHELHPDNSGQLQWGEQYRLFHEIAWMEVWRLLKPSGMFLLNISDHIRKGVVVPVSEWHESTVVNIGFTIVSR